VARLKQQLPFTVAAMLHVLADYRDVAWDSDLPEDRERQDRFLRDWARMHVDAEVPVPDFLETLLKGANRRRAAGYRHKGREE
jgi:hypothetical protein